MNEVGIFYSFYIGNFKIEITDSLVVQWGVILVLGIAAYLLTRNLKRIPNNKQLVLEKIYTYVNDLVEGNIGNTYGSYVPYVGTLVVYLMALNLIGIIGIEPPTKDLSVTFALGLSSFFVINYTAIKRNGVFGYAKGLGSPYLLMLPINIMERVMLPISLALRLFGNMLAGALLIDMIYKALGSIGFLAEIGLPIIVHGYFDLLDR